MARNWLITGAGSGFGRAIAEAAIADGDRVIGTVRSDDAAARLEAELPGVTAVVGELGPPGAAAALAARAMAGTDRIDVLVNNAGRGFTAAIEEASRAEIQALFDLNLLAPVEMIQAVLPGMRARGDGLIINITSISGFKPWSGTGFYCATKFALEGIGQTLAQEASAFGIKVMNVQPGALRTGFNGGALGASETMLEAYDQTAHIARRALSASDGRQNGDPVRAARALVEASRSPAPPLNLLLGSDALTMCAARLAQITTDLAQWARLSSNIDIQAD